jgi:hypothetical protein
MNRTYNAEARATFRAVADVLIPEADGMPSATGVEADAMVERILTLRPDLQEDFYRGIAAVAGKEPAAAARALNVEDPTALAAIGLVASAAYYMNPRVRELIGYPGQEKRVYDPTVTPEYVSNGMLQAVIDRGPIFRPTPK